jgi:hypothetical protein
MDVGKAERKKQKTKSARQVRMTMHKTGGEFKKAPPLRSPFIRFRKWLQRVQTLLRHKGIDIVHA